MNKNMKKTELIKYLIEKSAPQLIDRMLQDLLDHQPGEPIGHMQRWLMVEQQKDNEKPGAVTTEEVIPWCQFMQEKGVKRILSLLGDDEIEWYAEPIADTLVTHGFDSEHYTRTGVFVDGARDVILDAFKRADAAGEKIVVHCSGGGGRASLGLGLWLMHKYGLSAEEAAQEITKTAAAEGSKRKPDAAKLQRLMDNGTLGKKDDKAADNEKPGAVTTEEVIPWCQFMQEKGVKRILSLLGDDEIEWYAEPIADTLVTHGFDSEHYTRTGVFVDGARDVILDAFKRADAAGEKIVVHCSGGGGRASLGLGLWLMHKYGLSAEEAAQEITKTAAAEGSKRKPDAAKLQRLMDNGTLGKKDDKAAGNKCKIEPAPVKVLYICTHNRCRSILSEAISNYTSAKTIEARSAGSQPVGEVHPLSLKYLEEAGIPTAGLQSQSWHEFQEWAPDVVITVCDNAAGETCPVWFGKAIRLHWALKDPSKVEGSDEEKATAFRQTIDLVKSRVKEMDVVFGSDVDEAEKIARLEAVGAKHVTSKIEPAPVKVLYICTHNRCRSILSEAISNYTSAKTIEARSAGSQPVGEVHPLSLKYLEEAGIPTAGLQSQSWHEFQEWAPDVVITVCDNAAGETCPVWFGKAIRLHWALKDPSKVEGSDEEKATAFRQTIDLVKSRVKEMDAVFGSDVDEAEKIARLEAVGAKHVTSKIEPAPVKVLYICTHNRCRSILSEAISNYTSAKTIEARSAGSQPVGEVHPLSLKYLEEAGISTAGLQSQSWHEFQEWAPDVVITVCDNAAGETCPVWFGKAIRLHWALKDPSKVEGSDEEKATAFRQTIDLVKSRVKEMDAVFGSDVDEAEKIARLEAVGAKHVTSKIEPAPVKVLYICTHNRCRSILSEAISNYTSAKTIEARSAGSQPVGEVHPLSLKYLKEAGISTAGLQSQSWHEFQEWAPDVVITVCDNAAGETCPVWFGKAIRLHWALKDPSKVEGSDEEKATAFRQTIDLVKSRVKEMDAVFGSDVDEAEKIARLEAVGAKHVTSKIEPAPVKVLYICTHNRCRSILSEAISNYTSAKTIEARSAGSQPVGEVHPLSLKYLEEAGIPTAGLQSQSWHEFQEWAPDVVITVCDNAAGETCPVWFGKAIRLHWALKDPSKVEGSDEEKATAFRQTIDLVKSRVKEMDAVFGSDVDEAEKIARLEAVGAKHVTSKIEPAPVKVLYICTHNRCRSILSEAISNYTSAKTIEARSAGSQPVGEVHPLSLKYLEEAGIPTAGLQSQSWHEFQEWAPDVVITVCDNAAGETCPVWFGKAIRLHWALKDPSKVEGSDEEKATAFRQTIDLVKSRVKEMDAVFGSDVDEAEKIARLEAVGAKHVTSKIEPAPATR